MKLGIKFFTVVSLFVLISSCDKGETTCIAKTANGDSKYEIMGETACTDQISTADGEYCDCED
ncbi:hypothetical protein [Crocinitomix catalasitica]|uniref:hypothetical protein n=1 Tax=Crocinitomix catalasitica TaxID=184607 RepID=UPI0012FA76F1|nr:hypothetical protein [Crocinitomix catalasitica]